MRRVAAMRTLRRASFRSLVRSLERRRCADTRWSSTKGCDATAPPAAATTVQGATSAAPRGYVVGDPGRGTVVANVGPSTKGPFPRLPAGGGPSAVRRIQETSRGRRALRVARRSTPGPPARERASRTPQQLVRPCLCLRVHSLWLVCRGSTGSEGRPSATQLMRCPRLKDY